MSQNIMVVGVKIAYGGAQYPFLFEWVGRNEFCFD
jgi:hypothetical protein